MTAHDPQAIAAGPLLAADLEPWPLCEECGEEPCTDVDGLCDRCGEAGDLIEQDSHP